MNDSFSNPFGDLHGLIGFGLIAIAGVLAFVALVAFVNRGGSKS